MTALRAPPPRQAGYLVVLLVIALAFVAVAVAMQVLVLTHVGTASRAYDVFRQRAADRVRLERVVAEAILDQRQVAVPATPRPFAAALDDILAQLSPAGPTFRVVEAPVLPNLTTFPSLSRPVDPVGPLPPAALEFLTPELMARLGPRASAYGPVTVEFRGHQRVFGTERSVTARVRAMWFAVPLTRLAIATYELPEEIASGAGGGTAPDFPAGLVPARDPAFVSDLQGVPTALPYPYRRRASLAAAYRYVFSSAYLNTVSVYAGVTHVLNLGASDAPKLHGMETSGAISTWDLGVAGEGSAGAITAIRDAAVVFSPAADQVLRLTDSVGDPTQPALLLALAGPADSAVGPLTVELSSIARPIAIVGYNVRVIAPPGTGVNGALLLDPSSSFAGPGPLTVGHLSTWAGSAGMSGGTIVATSVPAAVEHLAPRVVYVATAASLP